MRLFLCTTCGQDTLTRACLHQLPNFDRMVQCPGFGCMNLVHRDLSHARHIALGMACCSEACHRSVYDLTRYVDGGEPEIPDGRVIRVDEALVINLTTADYRVIERG